LLDYLPRQGLILLDDGDVLRETIQDIEEQSVGLRKDYIEDGSLPADFPIPYLSWAELEDMLANKQTMDLGPVSTFDSSDLAGRFSPTARFGGRLKLVMDHLSSRISENERIVIVSRQCPRLQELWNEQLSITPKATSPLFIEGSLAEGWSFTSPSGALSHLLTDGEIFGWRRPELRPRHRPVAEAPEALMLTCKQEIGSSMPTMASDASSI
jgi:transcription-repair coupling factor (superfamily II helicase)